MSRFSLSRLVHPFRCAFPPSWAVNVGPIPHKHRFWSIYKQLTIPFLTRAHEGTQQSDTSTTPGSDFQPVVSTICPEADTATPLSDRDPGSSSTAKVESPRQDDFHPGLRLRLVIIAMGVTLLLTALENTAVALVSRIFISELMLYGNDMWITSAFFMSSAAVQPLVGQLCYVFGRREVMLTTVAMFLLGSGICGGTHNASMMIVGRAIQGLGSGGITLLHDIIVSDLVPRRLRGEYIGFTLTIHGIGTGLGPSIAGWIVAHTTWRWVFYMVLPLGGVALVILFMFLQVNDNYPMTFAQRVRRIDFLGNAVLVASTVSVLYALAYAGANYRWGSWYILFPLLLGFLGPPTFGRHLDIIDRTKRRLAAYFDRDEEQRFGMENVIGGGVAGLTWKISGTVETMVRRAIEYDIRLSNRFLWRVFLCLIRMCIAMGWPPRKPQGYDPQPVIEKASGGARTGLQHRDMHDGNLMFGSLSPDDSDGEHSVVPILKLIDFGGMNDDSDDDAHLMNVSVTENLFDVGRMMVELVTLDKEAGYAIYPSIGEAQLFRIATNSPVALTNGVILLPDEDGNNPFPYLDTNLRGLICACLAPEPGGRPRAGRLANAVLTAVKWRDESFYVSQGIPDESDDNLQSIVNQLLFDVS
ncbi:hypothetical protein NUW58_g4453 [Xylaria curta]|uniref:Uncharacterized protein n=1 Tax=Xylaria curta TaxID=42375 RepID=A0ACC1P694_9PEZI|nr:hypothetical protein NUW58_g4453 [Xylaria curta]